MKKILFSLMFLALPVSAFGAVSGSYPYSGPMVPPVCTNASDASYTVVVFDNSNAVESHKSCGSTFWGEEMSGSNGPLSGTYTLIEVTTASSCWTSGTAYADCTGVAVPDILTCDFSGSGEDCSVLTPPPSGNGLTTMIASSSAAFLGSTGFSIGSGVDWMRDHLLNPIMGTGLNTLHTLMPWITALIVIYICVYISYRAFRYVKFR